MKNIIAITLLFAVFAFAGDFTYSGTLQMGAEKDLYDNGSTTELDNSYGWLYFGINKTTEDFEANINAYALFDGAVLHAGPSGYFEGAFLFESAYVKFKSKSMDFGVGRFITSTAQTYCAGNYLDNGFGGAFIANYGLHDGLQLVNRLGILTSDIILNLRTDAVYTRIQEQITVAKATIGVAYQGNFDYSNRATAFVNYPITESLIPYVEVGYYDDAMGDKVTPILVGAWIPTGGLLNSLSVEAEILDGTNLINVMGTKAIGSKSELLVGVRNAATDMADLRLSCQLSVSIK